MAECVDNIEVRAFHPQNPSWPDHTLVQLYTWIREDATPTIFWRDGKPLPLNLFIRFLTDPGRVLFLPLLRVEGEEPTLDSIIGMFWLDCIEPPHAEAHFWIRKKHWWHNRPVLAAWKILAVIFAESPPLHLVVCRTNANNRIGVKFIKKMGAHIMGEIPLWYTHGEKHHSALLAYLTRADVEARVGREANDAGANIGLASVL